MKFLIEKRFVFQQPPQTPEQQLQPPPVDTGKEIAPPSPETGKEGLPSSPEAVSGEYKEKAKQSVAGANAKLDVFQNLKLG